MDKYAFGNYLTKLRTERGLSQSELGALVGVTNKAISKWENGEALPRLERLNALADLFGVTVEELVSGGKSAKPSAPADIPAPETTDSGKAEYEIHEDNARQYAQYLAEEERRLNLGKKLTRSLFLVNLLSIWLPGYAVWVLIGAASASAEGGSVLSNAWSAFLLCAAATLIGLLECYLVWRGYDWARWIHILLDVRTLIEGVALLCSGYISLYTGDALWRLALLGFALAFSWLRALAGVYLFGFCAPVKDLLEEQGEYYGN